MSTTIEIWLPPESGESKAALPRFGNAAPLQAVHVDVTVLTTNLKDFLAEFQSLIDTVPPAPNALTIDSIELSLGVNANGSIALIGKLEGGVSAAMKVTLKRSQ